MLKIRFGPFVESNWNRPMDTPPFNDAVRDFGIEIVTQNEDVLFQDEHYIVKGQINSPTIVWNRVDTSRVTPSAMTLLDDPNILGVCLPMLADEPSKSIAIPVYNRGVDYGYPEKPVGVITTMLWNRMQQLWTHSIQIPKKTIRASFCGIVHYPSIPFTQNHRRQMMDHWPLEKTFGMFNGMRHYYYNEQQQFEFIRHSKVVVSPWGVCEVSVRDYEAVMGCAMMVKPRQSKMTINCNPWHDHNTVYCEPDFSDLDEAVVEAEEKYDEETLRSLGDSMIAEGKDISKFAEYFSKAIKCCT